MKFCEKCGKEIMDEATVCPGCGCPVHVDEKANLNNESDKSEIRKFNIKDKKTIIIVSIVICAIVALVCAAIPIVNLFKANKISEELSGEQFVYNGDTSYSINRSSYTFDDEGNCQDYTYYYGITMDTPMEYTYTWTYKIEFKNNEAYVVLSNDDKLKIKYDDGEISGLYDSEERKTYERE